MKVTKEFHIESAGIPHNSEKSSCCNGLDSNEALNLQNGAIRVDFA